MYLGGVPGVRVDRFDFDQILSLSAQKLTVKVNPPSPDDERLWSRRFPRVLFEIPCFDLLEVSHFEIRHDMHAAQGWFGIRGKWPKATDHLIVVKYRLSGGGEGDVRMRVHKGDVEDIVDSLRKATQAERVIRLMPVRALERGGL